MKAINSKINFQFINPLEDEENPDAIIEAFFAKGMKPINITLDDKGKQTQEMVFPWAFAYSGDKSTKIPLLKNMMGASTEEKVISSVQHLEYAILHAFYTITTEKTKKVAVLKGNGQLGDRYMGDFLMQVRENYFIAPFTLDSVAKSPQKTLDSLKRYDLAIMAKPSETFTDEEKLVLDQYIMSGGKMLWLIDQVSIEMDSLYNDTGSSLAFPKDLNLNDLFFKYGFRINPSLVKDIMATPISLATGSQGSATQYTQFPWMYSPMIYPELKHPIVNNLDGLKFEFANPIDTLKNSIQKTVLLQSSNYSTLVGTPVEVALNMVSERPEKEEFAGGGRFPVAVLLEGNFSSVFQNRILPFEPQNFIKSSQSNQMIVVSDGDVIKNQLDKNGNPMELGFDKWTNQFYANKDFLLNAVNHLLDDNGMLEVRNKEVNLPLLDKDKVYENYTLVGVITLIVPVVILILLGLTFVYIRKKRYKK
jgi:gliding-associated putative ABC transporter substrate-binding component GldG